ncbi:MAG: helicase C-terminal domain-containing protein [Candidatus Thorarchaeota archaeon]|jgi:DNA excision repair protein ERCC-2
MSDNYTFNDFFPYESKREGQSEMMAAIESVVRNKQHFCCEAPNGFGKTCVTLAGILPWVKENDGKVLYCARTHKQLDRVVEELAAMEKGDAISGVSFRGRRHMCLNPFVIENADITAPISEVCGQLKASRSCAYYERLRGQTPEDILEDMPKKVMSAPDIVKYAKNLKMCPYEMAKKLAKVVDVVALSYLYVFDPFILATFIPDLDVPFSKIVLVQDEAHNVPTTALDSASDSLTLGTVRQAMREGMNFNDEKVRSFCRGMAKCLIDLSTSMKEGDEITLNPEGILDTALKEAGMTAEDEILSHMKDMGAKIRMGLLKAGKFPRSSIFRVAQFMLVWQQYIERTDYAFLLSVSKTLTGSKRVSLDLVALDPTSVTRQVLSSVRTSVAISGTISPLDAYSEMIGLGEGAVNQIFHSPFAAKNRLGIVVEGLDTSYKSRGADVYERMVEHCVEVSQATPGNTGIFATSYFIAKNLIKSGLEKKLGKKLYMEKQRSKSTDNDQMLAEFKAMGSNGGAVLLGVQGGRNSEGGDFPGSTMESVIVVGVPYARPTPRIESLISYFDKRFNGRGRDYAYVLPAMTRAIQAAGRPVRRLDDKGAIVMLDQRFATPYLRRFMPAWLDEVIDVLPDSPEMIGQVVERFFSN